MLNTNLNMLQFTVQPWSDDFTRRFNGGGSYDFSVSPGSEFIEACNSVTNFVDSAMIITDAKVRLNT